MSWNQRLHDPRLLLLRLADPRDERRSCHGRCSRRPRDPVDASSVTRLCEGCRQGHYSLPGGLLSNFPCQEPERCECWFCGPPVTPAQEHAIIAAMSTDPPPEPRGADVPIIDFERHEDEPPAKVDPEPKITGKEGPERPKGR